MIAGLPATTLIDHIPSAAASKEVVDGGGVPRFTLAELVACGAGAVVVSMMIDVQGFWAWDNRESLVEYDEDDRYAREGRGAARARRTPRFPAAARPLPLPSLDELLGEPTAARGKRSSSGADRGTPTLQRCFDTAPR